MTNTAAGVLALLEVPEAREIVGTVNRLSAAVRAAGGRVAFTRLAWRPDDPKEWHLFCGRFLGPA